MKKNAKRLLYLITAGWFAASLGISGQTIHISFPTYAGKEYAFYLWQGLKKDTVSSGALNKKGETQIEIGENGFRGVGTLDFGKSGALDVIINGEKEFSIVNISATDDRQAEFGYENSPENRFVVERAKQQTDIFGKNNVLAYIQQIYKPDEPFYQAARTERSRLENQYSRLQEQLHASPLYAARLCEIFDYLNHRGSKLTMSDSEIQQERKNFVLNRLDFGVLYVSGQWEKTTAEWIGSLTGNDSLLVAEPRQVLERISDRDLKINLTNRIMQLFAKYAKENLLPQIGVENLLMPVLGQPAPELILGDETWQPKNALILFYDSDCGNCRNELNQLIEKCNLFESNNLRVISIAADTDKNLFAETAQAIVWKDNYCDFKGFDGKNFVNYGVVGTPTIILIDKDGIVRGRYAQIKELFKN
ncbi:MAG: redoxin domain-containing protein [Candidatus Azobacteroides sp.]|nr:redoxin domain-containing protein [Candidatus Azobacteroides sp.]